MKSYGAITTANGIGNDVGEELVIGVPLLCLPCKLYMIHNITLVSLFIWLILDYHIIIIIIANKILLNISLVSKGVLTDAALFIYNML